MKKRYFLFSIIFSLLISDSCDKEPDYACGIKHPEENLPWLKSRLTNRCQEIFCFAFNGKEYIADCDCSNVPDGMCQFFDCLGNKTCDYGGANPGGESCSMPAGFTFEFYEENKKLIYQHD
jgi:hypothetical protein